MGLFDKEIEKHVLPPRTQEQAMIIYASALVLKKEMLVFLALKIYPMPWVHQVFIEAERMETVAIAYVQANPECTNVDVKNAITSGGMLNAITLGLDIVRYNPTYNNKRTFEEFKDAYHNTEQEQE